MLIQQEWSMIGLLDKAEYSDQIEMYGFEPGTVHIILKIMGIAAEEWERVSDMIEVAYRNKDTVSEVIERLEQERQLSPLR